MAVPLPLVGPTLSDYWNSWAADLSVMVDFFRPYFGMIAENGLTLLLGIASGVLQFLLALFIAFFFWVYGDRLGRLSGRSSGGSPARMPSG